MGTVTSCFAWATRRRHQRLFFELQTDDHQRLRDIGFRQQGQASGEQPPDWRVTLVDTGIWRNIGERLMAVKHLVEDEEIFLANYSDGLTDTAAGHRAHPRPQVRPRLVRHSVPVSGLNRFTREMLYAIIHLGQLAIYRHEGFWQCMNTLRDKQGLERLWRPGTPPWKRWRAR